MKQKTKNKDATKLRGIIPIDSRADTYDHINKVQTLLMEIISRLHVRSVRHDQSKLVAPEVELFDKLTPQLATLTFGTKEYQESLDELKPALDHHYAKNTHHPEHYENGVDDMDLLDVMEMLADWKAASMRHNDGNINKSLKYNKSRFGIDAQLFRILENTVQRLGWHE